ncbi:MAG TPA: hypothetical protein DDZ57_09820 [Porphyromonadaceae bacterium]|nr:hypothetical protein [Porphyromonadaceae bacterium]
MKIGKLFLAGIVALGLGLTGCNNDDVPELSGEKEATISIKVLPSSNGSLLRSTGNLNGDGVLAKGLAQESAIKSLEVWIFKGDVLDAYKSAAAAEVTEIEARIGARTVVVVANAEIGQKNSKAELLATIKGLPADVAGKGLVMTAEPFDVTLVKGNNYYGYTDAQVAAKTGENKNHLNDNKKPLPITRVNARVAIVSAELDLASVPANQKVVFDALKDVEVAMFNVPKETKLFGSDLAKNENYLFGAKWDSPLSTYVGYGVAGATATTSLTDAVTDALPVVDTNAPYYYVNESNGTHKMFIVLRAKVYKDNAVVTTVKDLYTDNEGYTYYPIWINVAKEGYTYAGEYVPDGKIKRNTQYNISLTIKGLGNPNIDPVDKAWLDVAVAVEDWQVVGQNVIW